MADDDEATPPGWYREADDPSMLRWWDGDDWTDDTMPVPSGARRRAAAAPPAEEPAEPAQPAGSAGAARRTRAARTADEERATTAATRTTRAARPAIAADGVEPAKPAARRTRRDAMAEAEADAAGIRIARTLAGELGEDLLPPVEILLDPQSPDDAASTPDEPAPDVPSDEPADAAEATGVTVLATPAGDDAEAAPVRRRRTAPSPDAGPGYRRPESGTVRILGDDRADAAVPAARHRAPATGPRPADRPPTGNPARGGRPPQPHRGERLAAAPAPATAQTVLRVIVRAGLIALVVGVGFVAYTQLSNARPSDAETLSDDVRTAVVDPNAPRLDQVVLTLADLPRGWTAQASDPQSDDICQGRIPRSVLEPTGIQSATFTADNGALIGNVAQEFIDDDTAKAFVDLTARVIDSCRQYSAENSTVTLSPLDFPRFGDETFAVEVGGTSPGGPLHGAIVYVRHGHRVSSILTFNTGDAPLDKGLVEHLTQLVTRRMSSKPAIGSNNLPGATGGELPGE